MSDGTKETIATFISAIVFIALTGFVCYRIGCRDGQIDALTGNVKYELRENADGTREWVEKQP